MSETVSMRIVLCIALALLACPAPAAAQTIRIQADAIYFDLDGTALDTTATSPRRPWRR